MTSLTFVCKIGEANHSITVEDPSTTTIHTAKELLRGLSGDGGPARWIYKGRLLQDGQTIAECGIEPGTFVIVMRAQATPAAPVPGSGTSPSTASRLPAGFVLDTDPNSIGSQLASTLNAAASRRMTASMDAAVNVLLSASEDVVHTAIETALKICSNVISNPSEAKYRRLPAANAGLNSKLLSVPGGRELLLAVGFELTADGSAWCLEPSGDRWATLTACYDKLAAFAARIGADRPLPRSTPTQATASAMPAEATSADQQAALATLLASIAAASLAAPAPAPAPAPSDGGHPGSGSGSGSGGGGDPGSGPGADGAGAGTGTGI